MAKSADLAGQIKSLLLLSLFAGLSYMLASLVAVYIERVKTKQTQEINAPAAPLAAPAPTIATTPAAKTDARLRLQLQPPPAQPAPLAQASLRKKKLRLPCPC